MLEFFETRSLRAYCSCCVDGSESIGMKLEIPYVKAATIGGLIIMPTLLMVFYLLCMAPFTAFRGEAMEGSGSLNEVLQGDEGVYSVNVEPEAKKVEVIRLDDGSPQLPYVRMKVLRKNDKPLEIHLRTMNRGRDFPTYEGHFDQWQNSYIGVQLEFSFDKKTWKKLEGKFKRILP